MAERRVDPFRVVAALAIVATLPTLVALAGPLGWPFELASHFRVQYAVVLVPATIILLIGRRFRAASPVAAAALINVFLIAPAYQHVEAGTPGTPSARLRVLSANVLTSNTAHARLLALIEREAPDVVILMEVNSVWAEALEPLRARYPHVAGRARSDNFGIVMYTTLPLELVVLHRDPFGVPHIEARGEHGGRPLTIIAAHPVPPGTPRQVEWRDLDLRHYAEIAAEAGGAVILAGDLNSTPWSSEFQALLETGGLREARHGFGLQPSWPVAPLWMRIPIDHVLVGDDVAVSDFRVGEDFGSDHLPIIADLEI